MTEAATRRPHTSGAPCWVSLMVRDLTAGQDFYHGLFGWEFSPGPPQPGPHVRALKDGQPVAGLGELPPGRSSRMWTPYLATDDADATAILVRDCGGTVAIGPLDAEDAGRMAIAADTAGAAFGLWQAREHPDTLPGGPGTAVWFELVVQEPLAVGKFYSSVFGHKAEALDAPDSGRVTLHLDGEPVAGVRGAVRHSPEPGPHWRTYFAVEDVGATAMRVQELGGTLVEDPHDSPWGRTATVADPEGVPFSVLETG